MSKPLIFESIQSTLFGGSSPPPSPPTSFSSLEYSSSEEYSSNSYESKGSLRMTNNQGKLGNNQGNQENDLATLWINQYGVTILGVQHLFPINPNKFLPKFDPYPKQLVKDHIKYFILAIRMKNECHEVVDFMLFPYTFEGKVTTWYFMHPPQIITSWAKLKLHP